MIGNKLRQVEVRKDGELIANLPIQEIPSGPTSVCIQVVGTASVPFVIQQEISKQLRRGHTHARLTNGMTFNIKAD